MTVATQALTKHAAALGRHGARKRWNGTTKDERTEVMRLMRAAKIKRAKEGKRPQNPAFAWMNAKLQRDNERSRGEER